MAIIVTTSQQVLAQETSTPQICMNNDKVWVCIYDKRKTVVGTLGGFMERKYCILQLNKS